MATKLYNTVTEYLDDNYKRNLPMIKKDFFKLCNLFKAEIPQLKQYIKGGKIDGGAGRIVISSGTCGCILATACKIRKHIGIAYASDIYSDSWSDNPYEHFIYSSVDEGDTPENNEFMKLTMEWLEEYEEKHCK